MRPGPPPYPKRRLNPSLRDAVRDCMRSKNPTGGMLSVIAGYTQPGVLSGVLHARRVSATPLTTNRLQKVADVIGFEGPLFLEEDAS